MAKFVLSVDVYIVDEWKNLVLFANVLSHRNAIMLKLASVVLLFHRGETRKKQRGKSKSKSKSRRERDADVPRSDPSDTGSTVAWLRAFCSDTNSTVTSPLVLRHANHSAVKYLHLKTIPTSST